MCKKYESTPQAFCGKMKQNIKKRAAKKAIVDKIFEPTATTDGKNAYRMRPPG